MTMQVVIQISGQPDVVIGVSDTAMQRARVSFNPSSLPAVDNIKALAAALYTVLAKIPAYSHQKLYERDPSADAVPSFLYDTANQEAFTAAQLIQLGAMMAVSAATVHLVK